MARMDGTPERSWLAVAAMHLEVQPPPLLLTTRGGPPKPLLSRLHSQPTQLSLDSLLLLYSFLHKLHWLGV